MRRGLALVWACALGCAGALTPQVPVRDDGREAIARELCAPLPRVAFECRLGYPASISPARREAVSAASDGDPWVDVSGVRAYALCQDRPGEDGPVAEVAVLLVDTAVATAEDVAERMPRGIRWTEACEDATDDCAHYLAHAEGDRLVLTRGVQRPMPTELDVARISCASIADGAAETHVRLDGLGALVREVHVETGGVAIVSRRPGRGDVDRAVRTWTELELALFDERVEHEADLRMASSDRPIDPEQVDVTSLAVLDLQIDARTRRLARDRSPAVVRDLARLAARGFGAHPSRPDLGLAAIELYVEAGEAEAADAVLAALEPVLAGEPALGRATMLVGLAAADTARVADALAMAVPGLAATDRETAARVLTVANAQVSHDAIALLPTSITAVVGATQAAHAQFVRPRGRAATMTPASGAAWAIAAIAPDARSGIAVCGGEREPEGVERASTPRGTTVVVATVGTCRAASLGSGSALELGAIARALLARAGDGPVTVIGLGGGASFGLRGRVSAGALRIDGVTPALVSADLERVQREIVAPLGALGDRVFPTPTLTVPTGEGRERAALAATDALEGVWCEEAASGVRCEVERGAPVDHLFDAAAAMFAAE